MKGRLFWKIFITFVVAFIAQVFAMYILRAAIYPPPPQVNLSDYRALQELLLDVRSELRKGGLADMDRRLFGNGNRTVSTHQIEGSEIPNISPNEGRTVQWLQGERLIEFHQPAPAKVRRIDTPIARLYVNGVGLMLGLVFAAALALYLSRPIRSLRRGLEAFAAGDLRVRLSANVGRRRDEVADLTRDFDVMADRVEELIRSREQLVNDVSHELRSPLARLRLAIALARQRPERIAAAFERIENETRRLDEIVDELLALSQLESGVADCQGYFDLSELLRKLIADTSFERDSVQVTFEAIAGDDPVSTDGIRGDAELIRRAVENVVRNGIRFSPVNGTVAISVLQRCGEARIMIEDEGPGVAPDELQKVFEPFVKGSGGGFGLGLNIARRAVQAHGGRIFAENRTPSGLRVVISLPTC